MLTSPFIASETSTFTNYEINYYINFVNPNAIVFQRINDCDERKNTNFVNKTIIKRNKYVDINIFVSNWLKDIFQESGLNKKIISSSREVLTKIFLIMKKKFIGIAKIQLK